MKSKKKVLKGFLRIGKNLYFLPIRNRLGRTETKKLDDLCPADLTGQKSDLEDRNQLMSYSPVYVLHICRTKMVQRFYFCPSPGDEAFSIAHFQHSVYHLSEWGDRVYLP